MKQIKLLCLGTLLGILTAVKAAPIQYFFENDLRTMPNYQFRTGDIIAIQIAEGKKLSASCAGIQTAGFGKSPGSSRKICVLV